MYSFNNRYVADQFTINIFNFYILKIIVLFFYLYRKHKVMVVRE